MGITVYGQLSFGVTLEEPEDGLPWIDDQLADWWMKQNGYVNPNESPFNDAGQIKDEYLTTGSQFGYVRVNLTEKGDALFEAHYAAEKAWHEANPVPFEVVNTSSLDYPHYIIAVPGFGLSASWDGPKDVDPSPPGHDALTAFLTAIKNAEIETDGKAPRWILSALYSG